jgi:hypothetical protein
MMVIMIMISYHSSKGEAVLQEEARQVLRILQKQEEIIKSYRPFSGPVSSSL